MQENIVILWGGPSAETKISQLTAQAVQRAMTELKKIHVLLEFKADTWVYDLMVLKPTFVFIAMHGTPGEDGMVQGVLESLKIPYNGSDMRSSVLAMDKSVAKKIFKEAGLDMAKEVLFTEEQYIPANLHEIAVDLPMVFKPNSGGSSVGVEIIHHADEWSAAFKRLAVLDNNHQTSWLAEEFIAGQELTITVMGDRTLGVMEIVNDGHEFYDYRAKYEKGESQHIYPASIATEVGLEAERLALKAHKSLGCSGVSRVDFRYNEKENRLVILEINTLPGMTATSLVPDAAKHNGLSFSALILWIIKDGQCRQRVKN